MFNTVVVTSLLTIGIYNILSAIIILPSRKSILAIRRSTAYVQKPKGVVANYYRYLVYPIAGWIAPFIKIDKYKKTVVEKQLKKMRLEISAEMFYARCIVFSALVILASLLFLSIQMTFVFAALSTLAVLIFFKNTQEPKEKEKEINDKILKELPQLVSTFEQSLKTKNDIVTMFEKYRIVAGEAFRYDLDVLISDFKLGGQTEALKNFEERLGMQEITEFVAALIGVIHGTAQSEYLTLLLSEMKILQREYIRREIEKRPRQIKPVIIIVMLGAMALIFTPIIIDLMNNMSMFR